MVNKQEFVLWVDVIFDDYKTLPLSNDRFFNVIPPM